MKQVSFFYLKIFTFIFEKKLVNFYEGGLIFNKANIASLQEDW